MQRSGWLVIWAVLGACGWVRGAERPNLIWILADDLGYGELGCFGQQVIPTPRLDGMAREGKRLTRYYAGATVCAPSRSVLMTGQHHGHTRVRGNAGKANAKAQALRPEDVTVAELLQKSGYRTALVGKWGLGDIGEAECGLPRKQGFDSFFGYLNQTHAHNHFPDFLWRNEEKVQLPNRIVPVGKEGAGYATEAKVFADDLFTEEALKFVRANQKQPFFLYWSMVIPHANNERRAALKNGAQVPDYGPFAGKDWPAPDKGHAAMVHRMDDQVGRMLDLLKELGLDKNTLVVFTSDNGPHNESNHNLQRFKPSGPFSGIKRSLKEGGIRVPFIAWWPGTIAPGTEDGRAAYAGDFLATAAELAGVEAPKPNDSVSLVPLLKRDGGNGKDYQGHAFLYWEFHEGGFQQAALYQGRWKGIRAGGPEAALRLYDTEKDPAESRDVAGDNPEIARKISDYLRVARTETSDWEPKWGPIPNRIR